MPAGGGGMSSFGGTGRGGAERRGSTQGAANQKKRPRGSKKQPKGSLKKKSAPKHNRGFNLYGMSGGKGSSMQSARRGKRPFSPAKARNIG